MYRDFIKPVWEFLLALVIALILSPVILLLTLLLAISNRGKPFFLQDRPGKDGKLFKLIKFKTMRDAFHPDGTPLPDKERITKVGAFVRGFSLDEFPQLFNVLKGDMAIIGPRPLLVSYLPLYSPEQARRHEVKPGITGWAQIKGRNSLSWDEKFRYDVWYVDNISFATDMKIFWMSFAKVVQRDGIDNSATHTMQRFTGNAPDPKS
ncbi:MULTISPECIES: sugar transferase [unclassified Flavobacterium]|uniref:sugar transferase n=1 Tax=unclassified Flavobacterium TaxID=196869 RepID=UPI001F1470EB|nr:MULTISPECIES: sugar transferase [unclassified Flavobacterium]UMY65832.1 sugar transferase [Flavobacterium sp. HJ-32-4]